MKRSGGTKGAPIRPLRLLTRAIGGLALLVITGAGAWLARMTIVERAESRRLTTSTAPWPPVPLGISDGDRDGGARVKGQVPAGDRNRIEGPDASGPSPADRRASEPDADPAPPPGQEFPRQLVLEDAPDPSAPPQPQPPESESVASTWVEPGADGCPESHPVKARLASHLYHLPGMAAYRRTGGDRCYVDAAAAERDGFVRAKR